VPAESGKPAHAFLGDIEGAITCEEIRLNGMYAFLETPLKNGDVIEMKFSKEDKKEDEGEKIKASSDTENKERAENRKTNVENRQEKEEPYVSQIRETQVLETAAARRGKNTEKKSREETHFKTNLEAADEIALQLRLRNLSGIIIVDFIDMKQEAYQKTLLKHLGDALAKDPVKAVLVDMTALGLVEITRKKIRKPLYEQIHSLI